MDILELITQNISAQDPTLDLGGMDLTKLPPEIGLATHLTKLSLRGNQLITLPAEIGLLTNLNFLSAADNTIEWLPAEIGQLTNLAQLNLKNNKLTELPIEMLDLDRLELLRLDRNKLDLPDDIVRKWDRPDEILAYYQTYCIPEPEPEVLSVERKVAIYFDDATLDQLIVMLCVPAEEFDGMDHDAKAERLVNYHAEHGLYADLVALLEIYRPGYFE